MKQLSKHIPVGKPQFVTAWDLLYRKQKDADCLKDESATNEEYAYEAEYRQSPL